VVLVEEKFPLRDRLEAGELLAQKLLSEDLKKPLLVAVPRGGVVVAWSIAQKLGCGLRILITRKIGAPFDEELAVGALTPDGNVLYNERLMAMLRLTKEDLEENVAKALSEIKRRSAQYGYELKKEEAEKSEIIVIDDGVATGFTLLAALKYLKSLKPLGLLVAVPVMASDALELLRQEADKVIYLGAFADFMAVSAYYLDFRQVEDEEVKKILKEVNKNA